MGNLSGRIIIAAGANVWPHEMDTARALASAGIEVRFICRREGQYIHTPDILINGFEWEIKSPQSSNAKALQRNLRKALHQANRVIIDSIRIKGMPDAVVERELRKLSQSMRSLRSLKFVTKKRTVIDIL